MQAISLVWLLALAAGTTRAHKYSLLEGDGESSQDSAVPLSRHRRTMALDDKRWTKYTVPYAFLHTLSDYNKQEIYRGMHSYERFTCMRFVEWKDEGGVTTNDRLDLGYEGHLEFETGGGCHGPLGNKRRVSRINCCSGKSCVHELGHSLGMTHEAPSPDRDGWMRANYQNMENTYPYTPWREEEVFHLGYDYSSEMHYASWMMSSGGPTFTFLFPELHTHNNYYYIAREVSIAHRCEASPACAATARTCDNEGYYTRVDGRCGCRCPQGLDTETGCTSVMTQDPAFVDFPGGEYAFPMPANGCPDGFSTSGTREHFGRGGNTESHPNLLEGEVSEDKATHHFCARSNSNSSVPWPAGNYCIYRKGGTCPNGFSEGSVRYDDAGTPEKPNSADGSLPDGQYTSTSTQFIFCCRTDGFSEDEIFFPSRQAFTLFKYPDWSCQPVRGMHSTVISTTIYSVQRVSDVAVTGSTPVASQDANADKIVVDICYYTPADRDCGGVYEVNSSNPTVNVTSRAGANQECVYLFKAPGGMTMVLNTPSINIHCDDRFEIRHARPQQPAEEKFCGSSRDKSTRSILNYFMVRFSTYARTDSHFTLSVSLVQQENHCYDFADRGTSYAGTVNVSRNFEPCLRWDEVTHCPHHAFSLQKPKVELSENYCRNPNFVDGFRPWCYTQATNCVRNYCDVCQLENRYDTSTTCHEVDQQELCSDTHRGMKFCAKTCENYLSWGTPTPRVSNVSCSAPDDSVVDGEVVDTPLRASYSVGSEVTYRCPDSGNTAKRTCLTSGTWSTLNTICKECPDGWSKYNGVCYKYYSAKVLYAAAKVLCSQDGGSLALAKTPHEAYFLRTLVPNDDQVYIGLTDIQSEGTWVWADGTPLQDDTWDNWEAGDPNNYYNQDCATLTGNREWADTYCAEEGYPRAFICQKPKTTVPCVDKDGQCESLFSRTPDMCSTFATFSTDRCRYTCGLCSQTGTSACPVPDASQNAEKVDSSVTSLHRGQAAHYKCKDGKVRVSGDKIRGCTKFGALTGEDLVCADTTTTIVAAGEVTNYASVAGGGYFYVGLSDQWRITHAGEVARWEYFSRTTGQVAFQVWRRRADLGQWKFQLVGQNVIEAQSDINWQFNVPPAERIQVEQGDVIGLFLYYWDKAAVPYAGCSSIDGPEASRVVEGSSYYSNPYAYSVGDTFSFDDDVLCRHFAFRAVVPPSGTRNLLTVSPGELMNYESVGSAGYSYMGVGDRWRITRPGEITQWDFYSRNVGRVAFQVWRRRPDVGAWQFELVGQNVVETTRGSSGLGYVNITEADRIQVQANDYVGLYYWKSNRGDITYQTTSRDVDSGSNGVMWSSDSQDSAADYTVGQLYSFSSDFKVRLFSFQATLKTT